MLRSASSRLFVRREAFRVLREVTPATSYVPARHAAANPVPAASGDENAKPPSRWQLLRKARREAPPPKRRAPVAHDKNQLYPLADAIGHMRSAAWAHFDESVELIFRLNLDPRRAEQNIRGSADVPHGTGGSNGVAVFAYPGPEADAAREAGADFVGADDLVEEVMNAKGKNLKGVIACVASPDFFPRVSATVGRILGPRGLMPNRKTNTVTADLDKAVERLKKGQCVFRTDRFGCVHTVAGKLSFPDEHVVENCLSITRAILAARPATVKKKYMISVHLCSSMGPSVKLDVQSLTNAALDVRPPGPVSPQVSAEG